jgi:thiol-disulfide isomerase/thioredoxin
MHKQNLFVLSAVAIWAAIFCLRSQAQTTQPAVTLNVGDPAPALKVGGWFKGTPVETFAPGKVYVVEFWATWCGPCRKMIPHLTELAKQHSADATFVGVSVWEHPAEKTDASIASMVSPFVKKMGDTMDYNVAADGVDGFMATHWMAAAGQIAIPSAFVIGTDQRVAWIGYPSDLGPVLDQVIAGKWDIAQEQKRIATNRVTDARRKALVEPILTARNAKDYRGTLAALDKAQAELPDLAANPDLISVRLDALLNSDADGAYAYIRQITGKDGLVAKKPVFVWSILRVLENDPSSKPFTVEQWKGIAQACEPMVKQDKTMAWQVYSDYSTILSHAGEIHEAVIYEQKAVDLASAWNDAHKEAVRPQEIEHLKLEKDRLASLTALDK